MRHNHLSPFVHRLVVACKDSCSPILHQYKSFESKKLDYEQKEKIEWEKVYINQSSFQSLLYIIIHFIFTQFFLEKKKFEYKFQAKKKTHFDVEIITIKMRSHIPTLFVFQSFIFFFSFFSSLDFFL